MDCWIPRSEVGAAAFRKATRIRRVVDFAKPSRSWRFAIEGAYLPRGMIRTGEDLRVRFSVRNLSPQEGTIYYVVNLRRAYEDHRVIFSTDASPRRSRYTACLAAGETQCIETVIPWDDLEGLRSAGSDELTLAVEVEIWTPRWMRTPRHAWRERLLRVVQKGMFHKVQLMHNPVLRFEAEQGTCFLSYAWSGRPGLAGNEHRAWVYRLADALSLAGYRPLIDFNFLAPALINEHVISRHLEEADRIVIVYSDDYLDRMRRPRTGVGFEYGLMSSRPDLWKKTIPIRRAVKDREAELFAVERRYVTSFEEGDLTTGVTVLVHEMKPPERS